MMDVRVAAPDRPKIKPAFMVRKLEGMVEVPMIEIGKDGKFNRKMVKEDAGWLVSFPRGHSIRVRTENDLKRLGFDQSIPLVDMNSDGTVVGEIDNPVVK